MHDISHVVRFAYIFHKAERLGHTYLYKSHLIGYNFQFSVYGYAYYFQVKSENYILVVDKQQVMAELLTDCGIIAGEREFYPSAFSFMFPKKSPYLRVVNHKYVIYTLSTSSLKYVLISNVHGCTLSTCSQSELHYTQSNVDIIYL